MARRRMFGWPMRGRIRLPALAVARRWTADIISEQVAASTQLTLDLVSVSDYEVNTNLEASSVTLARIRGSLSLLSANATAAPIFMGIIREDATLGTTGFLPNAGASLVDGDWLWLRTAALGGSGGSPNVLTLDIDVRVKRKLKNDDIRFKLITGAGVVDVAAQFRALLLGG